MGKRKTIEDVAKLAGVSKVTVSYVLNGHSSTARISSGTEERVLKAAEELGYRPNALARMLVTKRTDTFALVFQYANYFAASSSFITEVMRGVCEGCVESGMDLLLHTKPTEQTSEAHALMDGRVDGVLILRDSDDPTLNELIRRQFPCVLIFSRASNGDVAYVDSDNYTGGRIATQHLLDLGHRRIGMVRGPRHSVSSNDRFSGYRDALESKGLRLDPDLIATVEGPTSDTSEFAAMMSRPDRPTALFVWSDDVAFTLLRLLGDAGLSCPDDVSVVGFDSSDACERVHPALTSVRQPVFDMARDATLLLGSLIRGEPTHRRQILYPLTLDIRGSTARPTPGT